MGRQRRGTGSVTAEGGPPSGVAHENPHLTSLRTVPTPILQQVDRRRTELLSLAVLLAFAFALSTFLVLWDPPALLDGAPLGANVLRFGSPALALVLAAYLISKDRRLRAMSRTLLDERVVAAALLNRMREITLLNEAGRAVASSGDLRSTLDVVLGAATELLEADEGSVMLVDGEDRLVVAAANGRAQAFVGRRSTLTDGIAGYVVRTRQPLCVEGEIEMAELADIVGHDPYERSPVRSAMSVPLTAQDDVLGVLNLSVTHGPRRFKEYDLRTLELFAQQAAIAICQARLLGVQDQSTREHLARLHTLHADAVSRVLTEIGAVAESPAPAEAHGEPVRTDVGTTDDAPGGHVGRRGLRLLLVDDDPALLRLLQTALDAEGHHVHLASDGQTALTRIAQEHPDVVLLDLQLPVVDGWQVLEQLRQRSPKPRVVCMTGKHHRRDRAKAWTLGADGYVTKPFTLGLLLRVLGEVIARPEEERTERRREALLELYSAR